MVKKGGDRTGLVVDRRFGDDGTGDSITHDVYFTLTPSDRDKEMSIFFSVWGTFDKAVAISGFPRQLYNEARGEFHYG